MYIYLLSIYNSIITIIVNINKIACEYILKRQMFIYIDNIKLLHKIKWLI